MGKKKCFSSCQDVNSIKSMLCVCCGKELKNNSGIFDGGLVGVIGGGYGSRYDFDDYAIAICDDCVEKKVSEKRLILVDNQETKMSKLERHTDENGMVWLVWDDKVM